MSQFPIFHGISIAENAYIENLNVENLAVDPIPVAAGRVWFNGTDKVFKHSTLDANGGVIVRTFATAEDLAASVASLSASVNSEISRAQAAELVLQSAITAEAAARAAAVSTLTADLASEASRASAAEAVLTSAVASEASDRAAADQALGLRIDAIGSAFNYVATLTGGADAASAVNMATLVQKDTGDYYKVSTSGYFKIGAGAAFFTNLNDGLVFNLAGGVDIIDNTNSQVNGTPDFISVVGSTDNGFVVDVDTSFKGRVSTLESGLVTETSARTAADTALDTRVTTVEGQVNGKIGDLSTLTTTDKSTIVAAVNEVVADIVAEASTRAAADTALQGNLATESAARISADSALQSELDATQAGAGLGVDGYYTANSAANYVSSATSLKDADNKLDAALKVVADGLASEVSRATAGELAVRTDFNALRFTFQSQAAATVHTIAHNLNAAFVDFTVLVQRPDGKYRNDVVSTEEVDSNTLKVYLSTAQHIKAAVTSLSAI